MQSNKIVSSLLLFVSAYLFGLISDPYNHENSPAFALIPFVSIPLLLSFFYISFNYRGKKWFFTMWLWGTFATFARTSWLLNVDIPGKYVLIVLALFLLSLFLGLWFTLASYVIAKARKITHFYWPITVAALWVIIDYLKSLGEVSFPWYYQGYLLSHYHSIAQVASITGIWGLTFIMILASALLYKWIIEKDDSLVDGTIFFTIISLLTIWGFDRLQNSNDNTDKFKVAILQTNIDEEHWDKKTSLDNAFAVTSNMIDSVEGQDVDVMVIPESGIYTYINYNYSKKREIHNWVNTSNTPLIFGSLDYKRISKDDYDVYNTTFLARPNENTFDYYYKMKLVPVSEGIPYGWKFPVLSRIKIAGGGFSRGFVNTIWDFDSFSVAPTICYEAIYPNFNRKRVLAGTVDALVNCTNDSWFGISRGPYQHASMALLRSVELGVPTIRAAASGISFVSDGYGRIVNKSNLGTREIVISEVPQRLDSTFYLKYGDWFVFALISWVLLAVGTSWFSVRKK